MPSISAILEQATTAEDAGSLAAVSEVLPRTLVHLLEQSARSQQMVSQLVILLSKCFSRQTGQQHVTVQTAALQPAVFLTALETLGMQTFLSMLLPDVLASALEAPDADSEVWEHAMQVTHS